MGIAGSLRQRSYNRALLNGAVAVARQSSTLVPMTLDAMTSCFDDAGMCLDAGQ